MTGRRVAVCSHHSGCDYKLFKGITIRGTGVPRIALRMVNDCAERIRDKFPAKSLSGIGEPSPVAVLEKKEVIGTPVTKEAEGKGDPFVAQSDSLACG